MESAEEAGWIVYSSTRLKGGATPLARYRPAGDVFHASPGTLEHFLTERYRLYATSPPDRIWRADVHHRPWLDTIPAGSTGPSLRPRVACHCDPAALLDYREALLAR